MLGLSLSSPEANPKTKIEVHTGVGWGVVGNNGKEVGKEGEEGKACNKD